MVGCGAFSHRRVTVGCAGDALSPPRHAQECLPGYESDALSPPRHAQECSLGYESDAL